MHIMIDIETLGTRADAVTLSIGAIVFDLENLLVPYPYGVGWKDVDGKNQCSMIGKHAFYRVLYAQEQLDSGFTVDWGTLSWWMEQPNAWSVFSDRGADQSTLKIALEDLADFILENIPEAIWCKGPSFDIAHLAYAYNKLGHATPWNYRQVLDTRTVSHLFGDNGFPVPEGFIKHHALWDAWLQAQQLVNDMNVFRSLTKACTIVAREQSAFLPAPGRNDAIIPVDDPCFSNHKPDFQIGG